MPCAQSRRPLVFLADVVRAYRASGRWLPLMDTFSHHAYGLGRPGSAVQAWTGGLR